MSDTNDECGVLRHYYVDESGDGIIFNRKGQVILDTPGCMRHFILGLLDVENPEQLKKGFERVRSGLLADPYFRKVPSMQLDARKTARLFHAKDDIPEVRREVFRLLREHRLRFFAVVKRMNRVLEYVRSRNQVDPGYRYHPNELYDYAVRLLFRNRLHKHDEYRICFVRRQKKDRTHALGVALEAARETFRQRWGIKSDSVLHVIPRHAYQEAGLQAVDYFLWALQRLYERNEERYVDFLQARISLVHDVDDTQQTRYGVYYTKKKPVSLAAIKDPEGIE